MRTRTLCLERLRQEPEERRTLSLAAHCAYALNKAVLARDLARTLVSAHPDHPYGYAAQAVQADRDRLSRAAEELYLEALKRAPENPFYYRLLADFLDRWRRKGEAIQAAEKGLRYDPRDEALLRLLARLHRETEDLAKAEDCGRRALAVDPEQAESHVEAGLRQLERGEHEAAIATLRRGLALAPGNKLVQKALIEGHLRAGRLFGLRIREWTFLYLVIALIGWLAISTMLEDLISRVVVGVVAVILAQRSFFVFCHGVCHVMDPSRKYRDWMARALLAIGAATALIGAKLIEHHRFNLATSPLGVTLVDRDGRILTWVALALGLLVFSGMAASMSYYMRSPIGGFLARAHRARLRRRLHSGRL